MLDQTKEMLAEIVSSETVPFVQKQVDEVILNIVRLHKGKLPECVLLPAIECALLESVGKVISIFQFAYCNKSARLQGLAHSLSFLEEVVTRNLEALDQKGASHAQQ